MSSTPEKWMGCVNDRLLVLKEGVRRTTETDEDNREQRDRDRRHRQTKRRRRRTHREREVHMYICAHEEDNGGACRRRLVNSRRGHRPGSTRTIRHQHMWVSARSDVDRWARQVVAYMQWLLNHLTRPLSKVETGRGMLVDQRRVFICLSNGCAIINDPLSILRISLLTCDVSTCDFFQKIDHEILHKTVRQEFF